VGQFNPEYIFDDTEELKKINVKRIRSIGIWADNKAILGLEVRYDTLNGTIFKGPRHLSEVFKEKYAQTPWKLDADDIISRIRGSSTENFGIIWLEFTTKNGVIKVFGNSEVGNVSFDHQFQENETPIIVTGSFSVRPRKMILLSFYQKIYLGGDKPVKQNLSGLGFLSLKTNQSLLSFLNDNLTPSPDTIESKINYLYIFIKSNQ